MSSPKGLHKWFKPAVPKATWSSLRAISEVAALFESKQKASQFKLWKPLLTTEFHYVAMRLQAATSMDEN